MELPCASPRSRAGQRTFSCVQVGEVKRVRKCLGRSSLFPAAMSDLA
jgi:hypothetical protein